MRAIAILLLAVGCTAAQSLGPVTTDPGESGGKADSGSDTGGGGGGAAAIPDVQCAGTPDAGPAGSFNHISSELISDLGSPNHRGIDLVAPASAGTQTIEGDISYTVADKALEDEDVDLFACREGAWEKIGTARTDDEGHFALPLTDDARLPIGLRDMYVSVVGDRTGASFLALVAPDGAPLLVSDVDGTLTSSENAFPESLVTGGDPGVQPGAPQAYQAAAAKGMTVVYLTSRGTEFTADTRSYLAAEGFPRGPLRLSNSFVTLPGGDTVDFKTGALKSFSAGLTIAAGVGNRESDVEAYTNAGVPADRIFIKLPEYQSEVQAALDASQAIGFGAYDDLRTQYIANM
jgi:phosphatidate phosphatase PAH1